MVSTFHRKTHSFEEFDAELAVRSKDYVAQGEITFSSTTSFRRKMKSVRGLRFRPIIPAIIGVSLGFALSMFYIPVVEQQCLYDLEESQVLILGHQQASLSAGLRESRGEEGNSEPIVHATVAPKVSHFSYGLRPFYVASELGHRDKLLVGILTTEENIDSLVLAINNTWAPLLPKVIFFTPYSRDVEFYEKYNKVLGLPIVQLADVEEDTLSKTKLSFRMLKYMHEHYGNNFEWFMRVEDSLYLKPDKLVEFLNSVNSSKDMYIGRPGSFEENGVQFGEDIYSHKRYCLGGTGAILSRSTLSKLVPHLDNCFEDTITEQEDVELGRCIYKNIGLQCTWSYEVSEFFYHFAKADEASVMSLIKERRMLHAITMHPVADPVVMYKIHRYLTELELNKTFVETRTLQNAIKDMLPYLPDGVPEKKPTWPIGFRQPFKPTSRFEVLQWEYFTDTSSYGFSEVNPKVLLKGDYKKDVDDVKETAIKMLSREYNSAERSFRLINGYRRVDPRRGAEYILDIGIRKTASHEQEDIQRRVHLLRPYTKVESIHMPTAIEQRGIHLVLPVKRGEIKLLEEFFQMYHKVCLQTGENVVLLTVFINVKDDESADETTSEKFAEGKALITRYKQKYTWAQLPWIQIGVKQTSLTLLMDIVTMKLPPNALIFLTTLGVEFNVNFLNRCRVNALSGEQVFFPIPYAYYDPKIVYRQTKIPDVIPIHRDTGHWAQGPRNMACFDNKDYKKIRVDSDDFLRESNPKDRELMKIFASSPLHVFQAVDIDLRKHYQLMTCDPHLNEIEYNKCLTFKAEGMASRSQLALLMFEMERKNQENGATEVRQLL